jgi:hypothetical protein
MYMIQIFYACVCRLLAMYRFQPPTSRPFKSQISNLKSQPSILRCVTLCVCDTKDIFHSVNIKSHCLCFSFLMLALVFINQYQLNVLDAL